MVAAALISSVWGQPARTLASFVAESDVVFLDDALAVEKRPGYRVKVNSSSLTEEPGKVVTYRIVGRVGGPVPQALAALVVPLMALSAALAVQSTLSDNLSTREAGPQPNLTV